MAAVKLQRGSLVMASKKKSRRLRQERAAANRELKAAVLLQGLMRGLRARRETARIREEKRDKEQREWAATKIQSLQRQKRDTKRVQSLRQERFDKMVFAANIVRKVYIGHITRKRYLELRKDFQQHT